MTEFFESGGVTYTYDIDVTAGGPGGASCSGPDAFEPDDTYTQASSISTDGTLQSHCFDEADDDDWLSFTGIADQSYTIETLNLGVDADTILTLYDTDGTNEIKTDDDGGIGFGSRIEWNPTVSGTYYVEVTQWFGGSGPEYTYDILILDNAAGSCAGPDIWEQDDLYTEAISIVTDGTGQIHCFHDDGDQDWVIFNANAGAEYDIKTFDLDATDTELTL